MRNEAISHESVCWECDEVVGATPFNTAALQTLLRYYYLFVCEIIYLPPPQKWFLNGVRPTVVSDKKTNHSFGSTPNHENGRGSRSFSTRPPCGQVRRWQQKLRPARLFARRSPRHAAARLPATVVYRSTAKWPTQRHTVGPFMSMTRDPTAAQRWRVLMKRQIWFELLKVTRRPVRWSDANPWNKLTVMAGCVGDFSVIAWVALRCEENLRI